MRSPPSLTACSPSLRAPASDPPDGTPARKKTFFALADPVAYAYESKGVWYVATLNERDAKHLAHYTQCPASPIGGTDAKRAAPPDSTWATNAK